MSKRLKKSVEKGLSLFLSAVLILLLVPISPRAYANDEGSTDYSDYVIAADSDDEYAYGIPLSLIYNNHGDGSDTQSGNPWISVNLDIDGLPVTDLNADENQTEREAAYSNIQDSLLNAAKEVFESYSTDDLKGIFNADPDFKGNVLSSNSTLNAIEDFINNPNNDNTDSNEGSGEDQSEGSSSSAESSESTATEGEGESNTGSDSTTDTEGNSGSEDSAETVDSVDARALASELIENNYIEIEISGISAYSFEDEDSGNNSDIENASIGELSRVVWDIANKTVTNISTSESLLDVDYEENTLNEKGELKLRALGSGDETLTVEYEYNNSVTDFEYVVENVGTYTYTIKIKDDLTDDQKNYLEECGIDLGATIDVDDAQSIGNYIFSYEGEYKGEIIEPAVSEDNSDDSENAGSEYEAVKKSQEIEITISDLFTKTSISSTIEDTLKTWESTNIDVEALLEVEAAELEGAIYTDKAQWALEILDEMSVEETSYVYTEAESNGDYKATYSEGSLTITGRQSTNDEEVEVVVKWKLPDYSDGSSNSDSSEDGEEATESYFICTFTIKVESTDVFSDWNLGDTNYDNAFRLENDTKEVLLQAVNAYLWDQLPEVEKNEISQVDFFTAVDLDGEYSTDGSSSSSVSANFTYGTNIEGTVWGYYSNQIKSDDIDVSINSMESVDWVEGDYPGTLTVKAANSNNEVKEANTENYAGIWFNSDDENPYVEFDSTVEELDDGSSPYKFTVGNQNQNVAYIIEDPDGGFALGDFDQRQEVNTANGINKETVYIRTPDGIIRAISGVTYQIDTVAPTLQSWDVEELDNSGTTWLDKLLSGTIFFSKDTVTFKAYVVDEYPSTETSTSTNEAKVSGLDSVGISYTNKLTGNNASKEYTSADGDDGWYSLEIKGDAEVDTSSIIVSATDVAGNSVSNTADNYDAIPSDIVRLVADSEAPVISVSYDNHTFYNGSYLKSNRTLTVTISDTFYSYLRQYRGDQTVFTITRDGGNAVSIPLSSFTDNGTSGTYTYYFGQDGDWTVSNIVVNDLVGRTVSYQMTGTNGAFTIDKTIPTLDVSFDNNDVANGMYYKAVRTATLVVVETNFNAGLINVTTNGSFSGWTSNGNVHTATVSFSTDGIYTLEVSGEDLATNQLNSYSSGEFVIDLTMPIVEITGVTDAAYGPGEAVLPAVLVSDTNIDSSSTTIGNAGMPEKISALDSTSNPYNASISSTDTEIIVTYADPEEIRANDGIYTLTVNAYDLAGNTTTQTVTWSVNRFGSTFYVAAGNQMLDTWSQTAVDLTVVEVNPSGISDYSIYLSKDNVTEQINDSQMSVESNQRNENWYSNTYSFPSSLYSEDGSYSITIVSTDNASNTAENTETDRTQTDSGTRTRGTLSFAIDATPPTVTVLNPAEPDEGVLRVKVEDNGVIDRVVYQSADSDDVLDAVQSEDDSTVYLLDVEDTYDIVVTASDLAQNSTQVDDSSMAEVGFIALLIILPIILIAIVAYLIYRNRKKQQANSSY